jgi:hypothetical protein
MATFGHKKTAPEGAVLLLFLRLERQVIRCEYSGLASSRICLVVSLFLSGPRGTLNSVLTVGAISNVPYIRLAFAIHPHADLLAMARAQCGELGFLHGRLIIVILVFTCTAQKRVPRPQLFPIRSRPDRKVAGVAFVPWVFNLGFDCHALNLYQLMDNYTYMVNRL